MSPIMATISWLKTITAMDLRKEPGHFLAAAECFAACCGDECATGVWGHPAPMTSTSAAMLRSLLRGGLLDRVDDRQERFLVKRAGKAKAVLISVQDCEQIERHKQAAHKRFWAMTDDIRQRVTQYSPLDVQAAIDEAIQAVRHQNRKQHPASAR